MTGLLLSFANFVDEYDVALATAVVLMNRLHPISSATDTYVEFHIASVMKPNAKLSLLVSFAAAGSLPGIRLLRVVTSRQDWNSETMEFHTCPTSTQLSPVLIPYYPAAHSSI
jgi:hypothetical protein